MLQGTGVPADLDLENGRLGLGPNPLANMDPLHRNMDPLAHICGGSKTLVYTKQMSGWLYFLPCHIKSLDFL